MNTIQSKAAIILTSKATWTWAALFLYNAVNVNIGLLPNAYSAILNVLLTILGMYLTANHIQVAAQLGSTKV